MDISNIVENVFGNIIADITVGILITVFLTKYFESLSQKRNSIGALVLIEAEIQTNKHILENLLNNGLLGFEKEMRRGQKDEIPINQALFDDTAKFLRKTTDRLLFSAFYSVYIGLGNLENKKLLQEILNLYLVSYYYRIQTSFQMEQLNWELFDSIKNRIASEIDNSEKVSENIINEVRKINSPNKLFRLIRKIKSLTDIFKFG